MLKGGEAASIYGANAANGVVLITTKSGKGATTQIDYSTSVSASQITRLPSMLNASQFAAAVTQYAPQNVEAAADGEHRLVRADRPHRNRPGPQSVGVGSRTKQRVPAVARLPQAGRHHQVEQHGARQPRVELFTASVQRSPRREHQYPRIALARSVRAERRAVQRRSDGTDPADHRRSQRHRLLQLAREQPAVGGQSGGDPQARYGQGHDVPERWKRASELSHAVPRGPDRECEPRLRPHRNRSVDLQSDGAPLAIEGRYRRNALHDEPERTESAARDVSQLRLVDSCFPGQLRSDRRLFVLEVSRRVSDAQRVEPQHQPAGKQRHCRGANGSERAEHPGQQADLVLRAGSTTI